MSDIKSPGGYSLKDERAREDIEDLQETVASQNEAIATLTEDVNELRLADSLLVENENATITITAHGMNVEDEEAVLI